MTQQTTIEQTDALNKVIVSRSEHQISRANISDNALKVLYRLHKAGYQAFMVGGGVRDLSLGIEPKDFDVATDATPEQVKELFRNCRLIGRRFRLAHVHFGRDIIEVATFRALHDPTSDAENADVVIEDGRILRDNAYGTIEEDALRRDFTVNALYYNIADYSIVDYVGGMEDLKRGVVHLIGDPDVRFREDPVRMLRAVRFAVKLGFQVEQSTAAAIPPMAELLANVPQARLFEEMLKLLMGGQGQETFEGLRKFGLFGHLFPDTETSFDGENHAFAQQFVTAALGNTDARIAEDKPVTPAFLFGALMWPAVYNLAQPMIADGESPLVALQEAGDVVVRRQLERITIPKRFLIPMREIWLMQPRLENRKGRRPLRLVGHPRFRAAYDFLLLRAQAGEADQELADWWTTFIESDEALQVTMLDTSPPKRRRRRRRRKPSGEGEGGGEGEG